MKIKFQIMVILMSLILVSNFAFSQKPDNELTKEEAKFMIQELTVKITDLSSRLDKLNNDIESLKKELELTIKKLKDCEDALYSMLGATPQDVEQFRQQLAVIEKSVNAKKGLSDEALIAAVKEIQDLENQLNNLRMNKISLLPEFYNKIISIAQDIRSLYRKAEDVKKSRVKSYTVGTWAKDRDCLWNIAGKMDIYGDPFQWPKIWLGNKDAIKNPDIIYPGQVLTIPQPGPKTPEEIKAERSYWRNKKAMEQSKKETEKKGE